MYMRTYLVCIRHEAQKPAGHLAMNIFSSWHMQYLLNIHDEHFLPMAYAVFIECRDIAVTLS